MMRNVGQIVGIAMAGSILAAIMVSVTGHASLEALHTGGSAVQRTQVLTAFIHGMSRAYLVACLICFLGIWTSLVRGKREPIVTESLPPDRPPVKDSVKYG
jgi:hypothetical protein